MSTTEQKPASNKTRSFILGILGLIIAAAVFFAIWFTGVQIPKYLYSPTRFAFVTDSSSQRLSVIDLDKQNVTSQEDLELQPDLLSISTNYPMMAMANSDQPRLLFYDLKSKRKFSINLPSKPVELFFPPDQQILLVVMEHDVAFADYQRNTLYKLPMPDGVNHFTKDNLPVFSPLNATVWVSDPEHKQLLQLSVNQQRDTHWTSVPLNLPEDETPGPLAVNPQGDILAFSDSKGIKGYVFEPATGKLISAADLNSKPSEPIAPYMDANYRFAVFANGNGNVVTYNLEDKQVLSRNEVPGTILKIRGGWLNQRWTVLTDEGLGIVSPRPNDNLQWMPIKGEAKDLWVTGNGKTAVVTASNGVQQVMGFDIKDGTQQVPIDLPTILDVGLLRMGGNNSFCY